MKKVLIAIFFLILAHPILAQNDEPDFKTTINWLQNKVESYSRYVVIDSTGMMSEVFFTLRPYEEFPCKMELEENVRSIGSAWYTFNLSEIDTDQIEMKKITEVYPNIKLHDDVYLLFLKTRNKNKIIFCEYKGAFAGDTFEDQVVVGVKTKAMAERIRRGIIHAASMCGEKDDLFTQ